MTKRVVGIDVARALAIIGMIIVNFKIAFGDKGNEVYKLFASIFEGKASATFVVLAGVGIAFMSNNVVKSKDRIKLKNTRIRIAKSNIPFRYRTFIYTDLDSRYSAFLRNLYVNNTTLNIKQSEVDI